MVWTWDDHTIRLLFLTFYFPKNNPLADHHPSVPHPIPTNVCHALKSLPYCANIQLQLWNQNHSHAHTFPPIIEPAFYINWIRWVAPSFTARTPTMCCYWIHHLYKCHSTIAGKHNPTATATAPRLRHAQMFGKTREEHTSHSDRWKQRILSDVPVSPVLFWRRLCAFGSVDTP